MPDPLALYLHIPFCRTRCTYCAFNTYTGQSDQIPAYLRALKREIDLVAARPAWPVISLYFGGGTPSLVPADEIAAVIATAAGKYSLAHDIEITLEANPGTVEREYLADLRRGGVNRLSLGMQSADAADLRLFARRHAQPDVQAAVEMARAAGFANVSLDLIYGVPYQTMHVWQNSLNAALRLEPDHLSLYSLSIEESTPLERATQRGTIPLPDPDLAADMYEWASDRLAAAGYEQYEISNWARPGCACRHNVHIWRSLPYLGLGAGAHGCAGAIRYANVLLPGEYIRRVETQRAPLPFPLTAAAEEITPLDLDDQMAETMFMGLRLLQEGVAPEDFRARFGRDLWSVYGTALDRLAGHALVQHGGDGRVRLTSRGRLLGNRVFMEFV